MIYKFKICLFIEEHPGNFFIYENKAGTTYWIDKDNTHLWGTYKDYGDYCLCCGIENFEEFDEY